VAAAADGELEAGLARRVDHRRDVIGAGDPRHRERPLIDALEEDLPRLVVGGSVRSDQLTPEPCLKIVESDVLHLFWC
jgi:hypothetical protein